jgi:hypothetical protein
LVQEAVAKALQTAPCPTSPETVPKADHDRIKAELDRTTQQLRGLEAAFRREQAEHDAEYAALLKELKRRGG